MAATITFLRRTQEEVNVFGGDVYIDIDGRNIGKLGFSDFPVTLTAGKHTIKMYKSHTYDTFIGVAEQELFISEPEHLMVKYSAPMVVSQPGNMVVSPYSKATADSEAQRRSDTISREYHAEQERKEEAARKSKTAITIIIVLVVLSAIVWGIYYASVLL
jgi:hypothetical protein